MDDEAAGTIVYMERKGSPPGEYYLVTFFFGTPAQEPQPGVTSPSTTRFLSLSAALTAVYDKFTTDTPDAFKNVLVSGLNVAGQPIRSAVLPRSAGQPDEAGQPIGPIIRRNSASLAAKVAAIASRTYSIRAGFRVPNVYTYPDTEIGRLAREHKLGERMEQIDECWLWLSAHRYFGWCCSEMFGHQTDFCCTCVPPCCYHFIFRRLDQFKIVIVQAWGRCWRARYGVHRVCNRVHRF